MTKKDAILKAATELFMKKGYDGTSTAEIAERAGVAHGTIFHHFGKKERLLQHLCEETVKELLDALTGVDLEGLSGLDALDKVLRRTLHFIDMHWKNICVVMHEMPHTFGPDYWTHTSEPAPANMQQIYDLRRSLMERGIADGSIRKCNVEATVYMVECFFAGIIHTKMKGFLETPDNVIDEAMMMFRRSIEA